MIKADGLALGKGVVIAENFEEAERAAAILKEEMEHAVSLKVPLTVEISSGASWYDAK